jgi:hypothetical protein
MQHNRLLLRRLVGMSSQGFLIDGILFIQEFDRRENRDPLQCRLITLSE